MNPYQIIKRPVVTEKATQLASDENTYVFEVDRNANKIQIKKAIEQIYGVHVESVRVVNVKPKRGRWGRKTVVRKHAWKKAYVRLREGDSIQLFEGV